MNNNLVVGAGRQGRFYKSVDGGNNWTVTAPLSYAPSFSVAGTNPTSCGGNEGSLVLSGFESGKSYAIKYTKNDGSM